MPRRNPDIDKPIVLTRSMKAHHIVFQKGAIAKLDENTYTVQSQSGHGAYVVVSTPSGLKCNCPDSVYRGVVCKHSLAITISQELRRKVEEAKQTIISEVKICTCRYCNSENIVRDGVRHTKKSGDIQKYNCRNCNRYFTINIGFEKMHASPQMITSAMQLYFGGESFRNVQKFLRLQGVEITHQTVYNWTKKYVSLMKGYLDKVTPQVSNTWRTDELFLKVKGDTRYLYAIMDDQTRFIIAQQVADSKYTQDVRPLFKEAKEVAGKKPTTLISDGAFNFQEAYQRELYSHTLPRTQHIRHIHLEGDHNNNKMERLNGEIRDREKTMRNVKKMDTPVLKGYQLYHNYFREHEGLKGKTPAEIAGIKIAGNNRWITVIQNASKFAN